ncbi:MAG: putative short-chain dehydrogenase/reductase, family [Planctomycetaceae bacterium]|nr:putative short-chain dehydrogenase/reductase, family [Planctomycetaceae bacterium]
MLVARRGERLQQLATELQTRHDIEHVVIALDLSTPEAARILYQDLELHGLTIDILVNNAGFGRNDDFTAIPMAEHVEMMQLNMVTLVQLTHLILPQMIARRRGTIVNVGSTASFQPGPYSTVYFATKAFVLSFSEGLSQEVREHGVTVTCLCPGPTRTDFGARSRMDQNWNFIHGSMSTDAVCDVAYRGLRRRKRIIVPGILNWILAFSVRFTPRFLILQLMQQWQRPRKAP